MQHPRQGQRPAGYLPTLFIIGGALNAFSKTEYVNYFRPAGDA